MQKRLYISLFTVFSILVGGLGGLAAQTLSNGANLSIQSGATLHVKGSVSNEGSGTFSGDGTLAVSGDLTQNSSNAFSSGLVVLNGMAMQNIGGSQIGQFNELELNNAAGLILNQTISISNTYSPLSGTTNLNGNDLELSPTASIVGETNDSRIFGTGGLIHTTRNLGVPAGSNIAGMGLELTSTTDLGMTRLERGHTAQAVGSGNSINRYFNVEPTNNSNLDASMRMYFFADELNGQNAASLTFWRQFAGATDWTPGGGTADAVAGYVEGNAYDAMGIWTLSADGTSSIDLLPSTVFRLFPNPAHSGRSITLEGLPTADYDLSLIDMQGRQVLNLSQQTAISGSSLHLELPKQLASGMYILSVLRSGHLPAYAKIEIQNL